MRSIEFLQSPPARTGSLASQNPVITGLTADSRLVKPGFLFIALPGTKSDGRRFIDAAIQHGAAAILTDFEGVQTLDPALRVPVFADANPRKRLAHLAARFYGPQPATIVAVTGTNGKTSTASFVRQIWSMTGRKSASIGTLGIETSSLLQSGSMTTPDPVTLHKALADLAKDGIDHVVLEASSHGIDQFRLDGVTFKAAAFTNLTQDHLDYHESMQAYFAAKCRLFEKLLPSGGTAVLNAEIPEFETLAALARSRGQKILDFGRTARAVTLIERRIDPTGQSLTLDLTGQRHTVHLPLVGEFQAMNALAALGLALGTGVALARALDTLPRLAGVRGRMELIATTNKQASVYVDYAHTPDGLEKVLTALRPHTNGQLVCVFGAGGDRDPTKRPKMGAIVGSLADTAVVTDDNPRSESPALIRASILAACANALEIGDRAEAIRYAIKSLEKGDVLVIAGKGHEQGQIVGNAVLPFDDAEIARSIINKNNREVL